MVVYALLGTSRPLSVSTTTTIAILSASPSGLAAPNGSGGELVVAAATLAMLVGVLLLVAGVLRLGFVGNFISEPVLTGFKSAIGLVIVVDQIPKLLGIHIMKAGFFRDVLAMSTTFRHVRCHARGGRCDACVHLCAGTLCTSLTGAVARACGGDRRVSGVEPESTGVATIGAVPGGLPSLIRPQFDLVGVLWPAAAGIALMSFTGRSRPHARSPRPESRGHTQSGAPGTGCGNVAGGLLGAMPAGGGTTQTAVNAQSRGMTQLAALVTAAAAVATLLVFAPVIALMPQAALAAVVVAYSIDLIQPGEFRAIRRVRRIEFRGRSSRSLASSCSARCRELSSRSSRRCSHLPIRPTTRRCMSSAASVAPRCSVPLERASGR